jgi:hypothetical protein
MAERSLFFWLDSEASLPEELGASQLSLLHLLYKGSNADALTGAESVMDPSSARKQNKKRERTYWYDGYGIKQSKKVEKERKLKF